MRTLEEVQKELDEVEAQIKAQQEGMPNYGDPGYRAARFDYIVHGDRSGLDAYQSALNAAIQNKLNRESSEYMAELNKGEAALEKDDEIVKHISDVDAVIDDLKKRNYSDDSVEMKKAKNEQDYWLRRADRRGLNVSLYRDTPKAPAVSNTTAPVQANAAPIARTFENVASDIAQLGTDSTATMDRVAALRKEVEQHKSTVPYDKVDPLVNKLNEKEKSIKDSNWATFKDEVEASIKAKDINKLKELQKSIEGFEAQDKATIKQKIDAALKPKPKSPLPKYIKNTFTPDIIQQKYMRDLNEKGEVKLSATIGGKSLPFKIVRKPIGDIEFVDEKGNVLYTFKAKDFDIEATASKKKESPVAGALKSGWTARSNIKVGDNEDW